MRACMAVLALACVACGSAPVVIATPASAPPTAAPRSDLVVTEPGPAPPPAPVETRMSTLPAIPAPGIDGAPAENLAAWSAGIDTTGEHDVVAIDDALLVIDGAHFTRVPGDGTSPILVRENPVGRAAVFADDLLSPTPVADGAFLLRGADGVLAAVDVTTLAVRWQIHRMDLPPGSDEAHLSSGDAFLVVLRDALLALDPASGHILWQTSFPGRSFSRTGRWRAGAGLFVTFDDTQLVAREARTGIVRWQTGGFDSRSDRFFDVDDDRLVILHENQVVVVALADGAEVARVSLGAHPPWGRTVALRQDELYVLVPTHGDHLGEMELRRYDLAHTAARWRSIALATEGSGEHPSLAVDDDVVLVCATSWFARALDRADGRERWSGPVARCGTPAPWRPRAGAPNVLMLSDWSDAGLARGATEVPIRRVTVTGTIVCRDRPAAHARVWVDGTRVTADANGRYRASTRARTEVVVAVPQFERDQADFCIAARQTFPVADRVDASFELETGGGGGGLI